MSEGVVDFEGDAIRLYARAMERRQLIVDEWERLDRPVVSVGSRKQVVPHPLVRMLAEADLLCERFAFANAIVIARRRDG